MPKVLKIRKYPDPILLEKAEAVGEITPEIRILILNMLETMDHYNGLGLAAPQVGVSKRIIVFRDYNGQKTELVNPVITNAIGEEWQEESCLSIPGFSGFARRHAIIYVVGMDMNGFERQYDSVGLNTAAQAIQHEIDHLDGILFVDRLNRHSRRAWAKFSKKRGWK